MVLPNEINSILALDIPAGDRIGFMLPIGGWQLRSIIFKPTGYE